MLHNMSIIRHLRHIQTNPYKEEAIGSSPISPIDLRPLDTRTIVVYDGLAMPRTRRHACALSAAEVAASACFLKRACLVFNSSISCPIALFWAFRRAMASLALAIPVPRHFNLARSPAICSSLISRYFFCLLFSAALVAMYSAWTIFCSSDPYVQHLAHPTEECDLVQVHRSWHGLDQVHGHEVLRSLIIAAPFGFC